MLSIRKVEEKDKKILFNWANDPDTRKYSGNSDPIVWEEHTKWFEKKLNDLPDSKIFMVLSHVEACFVRFEKKGDWYVGIVVAPIFRGKGLANESLSLGIKEFYKCVKKPLYAEIKKENIGSIKIFQKNKFKIVSDQPILKLKRDVNENR
jgi:UDP-2,4-diacetamido-2,4,6-trideoxy-beta-L-altropyranose hydrolase